MKWSVLGLVVAGTAAALCAALLVVAFRAGASGRVRVSSGDIRVACAARELAEFSRLSKDDLTVRSLPRSEAPEGFISEPATMIGRVLSAPMLEGQIFTKGAFVPEGSGHFLAARIPEGMRAVSVLLDGDRALGQVIYPGCFVDVLAGFQMSEHAGAKEAQAGVLVENVEVLGVENRTLTASARDDSKGSRDDYRRQQMVALLVNPEQAKIIQLAMDYGSVSLALRNPSDGKAVSHTASRLSDIRRNPSGGAAAPVGGELARLAQEPFEPAATPMLFNAGSYWKTEIIRGSLRDVQQFELTPPSEQAGE